MVNAMKIKLKKPTITRRKGLVGLGVGPLFRNMSVVRKKRLSDLFANSRLLKGGPVKMAIKKGGPVKNKNIKLKKK